MKTIRLIIFLLAYSVFAVAQQKDVSVHSYRSGDKIFRQEILDFPVSAKADSVWDYSNIKLLGRDKAVEYDSDSEREGVVAEIADNTRYYYVQDSASVRSIGYENNNIFVDYDRAETVLRFPFALGIKEAGVFHGCCMYCESVMARQFGIYSFEVDGRGRLILPDGKALDNVYRVHTVKETCRIVYDNIHTSDELKEYICSRHPMSNDSIMAYVPNHSNDSQHSETYKWYAEGYRYPILEEIIYGKEDKKCTAYYYAPEDQEQLYDVENENIRAIYSQSQAISHDNQASDTVGNIGDEESLPYTVSSNGNAVVVDISRLVKKTSVNATLADISGIVLRQASGMSDSPLRIDCTGLKAGEYGIRIKLGDKIYETKLSYVGR